MAVMITHFIHSCLHNDTRLSVDPTLAIINDELSLFMYSQTTADLIMQPHDVNMCPCFVFYTVKCHWYHCLALPRTITTWSGLTWTTMLLSSKVLCNVPLPSFCPLTMTFTLLSVRNANVLFAARCPVSFSHLTCICCCCCCCCCF